jgi:oligopeptide transport system substrate-binding protein
MRRGAFPYSLAVRHRGALVALVALAIGLLARGTSPIATFAASPDEVRILAGEPGTFDPALQGDLTAAAVAAQLHETLTAYDAALQLQPALAASWDVGADGRNVVFHLREGLTFSDGTPMTAEDVVGSWLRIIDPDTPSPLAALMLDVKGARAHLAGQSTDPADVGLRANGLDVEVELERPGADFPAIVSASIFAVVTPAAWRDGEAAFGPGEAVSGGYTVASSSSSEIVLQRNDRYWAGPPAIPTVRLVLDIGGRSSIAAFEADDLDYAAVQSFDAPWIPYDPRLGPHLRETSSLDLTYLVLDTTKAPFDDLRVRQALGAAVDWERVVTLSSPGGTVAAHSLVPPGIPGGGDGTWLPVHDPDRARELLADAGYPGGAGLPLIEFASGGTLVGAAIAADLERVLGMRVEEVAYDDQSTRINTSPPNAWIAGWIADFVGPNDFLGVLLESDSGNNDGGWASPAFDRAIADALSTRDPATAQAAYERAMAEVQAEVPVVPLFHSTGWALSREGLLGAADNGLGILRIPGMAWAE